MNDQIEQALKEAKRKLHLNGLAIVCLRAIISRHLSSVQEWVKVTERLPPIQHGVNVWCPENKCVFTACLKSDGTWSIFGGDRLGYEVSHWKDVPAPPSASTQHECEHEWKVDTGSMEGSCGGRTNVRCVKCRVPGEREDATGEVYWPTT